MRNSALPDHAHWRYTLGQIRFKGRASLTLTDRKSGETITYADVEVGDPDDPHGHRVAAADVPDVVRAMVRTADARRPLDDPIGEAARAASAVWRLRHMHAESRAYLVDPVHYASVLAYLGDICAMVADLSEMGAEMCEALEDMGLDVDAPGAVEAWKTARMRLGDTRAGALGACKGAGAAGVAVGDALGSPVDCGDCRSGVCHWGDTGGGRLETARRAAAAGEICGCARHDVSVALRGAAPRSHDVDDVGDVRALGMRYTGGAEFDDRPFTGAELGALLDDVEAGPGGGLISRVAAWAETAGLLPDAPAAELDDPGRPDAVDHIAQIRHARLSPDYRAGQEGTAP